MTAKINLLVFQIIGWISIVAILALLIYHFVNHVHRRKELTIGIRLGMILTAMTMSSYVAHIVLLVYVSDRSDAILSVYYWGRILFYAQILLQIYQGFSGSSFGYNPMLIMLPLLIFIILEK